MEQENKFYASTFSRHYNIGDCLQIVKSSNVYSSPHEAAIAKKNDRLAYVWEVEKTSNQFEWKIRSFLGSHTVNLPRNQVA